MRRFPDADRLAAGIQESLEPPPGALVSLGLRLTSMICSYRASSCWSRLLEQDPLGRIATLAPEEEIGSCSDVCHSGIGISSSHRRSASPQDHEHRRCLFCERMPPRHAVTPRAGATALAAAPGTRPSAGRRAVG